MARLLLFLAFAVIVGRAFWRLADGVLQGLSAGAPSKRVPARVHMERDPVCGTFVVPSRAISVVEASGKVHFCSTRCRDTYQMRQASRTSQSRPA